MKTLKNKYFLYAIFSAILFGASTPAAKYLLGTMSPWLLAGIFYLGSGIGIFFVLIIQSHFFKRVGHEPSLTLSDWKWLGFAILSGGVIGPVLLMSALVSTGAASASLLLTLEGVFTAVIAWIIFKEHTDRKLILGVVLIVAGCFLLGFRSADNANTIKSTLLVAGACLAWAIDNNLTRNISHANPLQIVAIKSTVAGLTNTFLAIFAGAMLPSHLSIILISGIVGFMGYGFSLLLFFLALRHIGTARTGAYFSLAPFVGVCLAIIFLGEPVTWQLIAAGILMGTGIWLHVTEHHEHEHVHERLIHNHQHMHDEHHKHSHSDHDPPSEPHTHLHKHSPLRHTHFHYPDAHHRHGHKLEENTTSSAITNPTRSLKAQNYLKGIALSHKLVVLFLCVHNAGRSLAARVLLDHYAQGRIDVQSAGSEPGEHLNPSVVAILIERGLDPSREFTKPLSDTTARLADVIITMGCRDTCPAYPCKRYLDWELEDPAGKSIDEVRLIVDEIDRRVQELLAELFPSG